MRRVLDDRGVTLVELMITIFLLGVVGVIVGAVMASALQSTRNVEGAARSNDDVRLAVQQIERDFRSADQICEPTDGAVGHTLSLLVKTASGVEAIEYSLDLDKDNDGLVDGDGVGELTRAVDGGSARVVVGSVVNEFVAAESGEAQPLFTSQDAGDEPGAPSFGKVVSLRIWVDGNPRDAISPKLETTELAGRNIWNPNAGC